MATQEHAEAFTVVSLAAGIITAAAVLRAAGRIFLGIGAVEAEAPDVGSVKGEAPETPPSAQQLPLPMAIAPLVALAAGAAWNLWPALGDAAPRPDARSLWTHAIVSPVAAIVVAGATLLRNKLPFAFRRRTASALDVLWTPLRRLHSGHIGDQLAWLTVGAGIFAAAFAWLGR